jgi:hypothetical protein
MADRRRSQRGEQRRLARLQTPVADAGRRRSGERLRRRLREGESREAGAERHERRRGDRPRAHPVDQRTGEGGGHDGEARDDPDHEAGDAEAETAAVVEVDDLERHHAAPAEVVQEDACLNDPELSRQVDAQEPTDFVIVQSSHLC